MIDHHQVKPELSGEIVVVTGPPGSGKSTVSAALAAGFARGVHLESDWFYRCIRGGFVAPHLPEANEQNEAVMDIATDAAAGFAEAGYVAVWDGIVGPWFLDRIRQRLGSRDVTLRYLVLRAERETALDRVRRRDGTVETSGAEQMWGEFADLGDLERHVVSASGSVEDVLARCLSALRGGDLEWLAEPPGVHGHFRAIATERVVPFASGASPGGPMRMRSGLRSAEAATTR